MKRLLIAFAAAATTFVASAWNSYSDWFDQSTDSAWAGGDYEIVDGSYVIDADVATPVILTPSVDAPDTNTFTKVAINAKITPAALSTYDDLSEEDVQTALIAAFDNSVTNYYAWLGGAWVALSGATPGDGTTAVGVTITFDYTLATPRANFKVGETTLNTNGVEWIELTGVNKRAVSTIAFAGSGTVNTVDTDVGIAVAMVEGVKYETFAEALAAAATATHKTITVYRNTDGTQTVGEGALACYEVKNGQLVPIVAVYSTDSTVSGSSTAYTSNAGNANIKWQAFNFRSAVTGSEAADGHYFYVADGDTDIGETDVAVKLDAITLTWGNSSGGHITPEDASKPYLVVTTPDDDAPVVLGCSSRIAEWSQGETSTFEFSNLILASNAKYRFYFATNDVPSVGSVLLEKEIQGRINGRYHGTSSHPDDSAGVCCSGGTGYSINCSFAVSRVPAEDAVVLKTGASAVQLSSVDKPVVIEGKVANGEVEVASGATVGGIVTVVGEATTLKIADSLTATAFYLPAATTIDATDVSSLEPTGGDSDKTTQLLFGKVRSDAALTVVPPELGTGFAYQTVVDPVSGVSIYVFRGANYSGTISTDVKWSDIRPEHWVDNPDVPTVTVNYEGEEPVTLTFDEAVTAGSLTLTGNIVVEASAAATFGTVIAGAGSVVEMANLTITTQSGSGVYRYRSGYPSTVPNQGLTYEYVGTADPENPGTVTLNGMRGTVRTTGYMSITGYYPLYTAARLDVVSGTTTLSAGFQGICGYITIREGATLKNLVTDSLAYSSYNSIIDIYGTLDMGTSRWTVWSGATFNLRGGEITGVGEGDNGAIDLMGTCNIIAYADSTISANVKFRNALSNITVSDGVTLTISGITKPGYVGGGITKKGAGTLKFTSDPYVPGGITVEAGTLAFDTEDNVTVKTIYMSKPDASTLSYTRESNWKGTVQIKYAPGNQRIVLNAFGNADSIVEIATNFDAFASTDWTAGTAPSIEPEVKLSANWVVSNGWSNAATTFSKLSGTGNLIVDGLAGGSSLDITNVITRLEGYTGTLGGRRGRFVFGTIVAAVDPVVGTKLVNCISAADRAPVLDNAVVIYNNEVKQVALGFTEGDGVYVVEPPTPVVPEIKPGESGSSDCGTAEKAAAAAEAINNDPAEYIKAPTDAGLSGETAKDYADCFSARAEGTSVVVELNAAGTNALEVASTNTAAQVAATLSTIAATSTATEVAVTGAQPGFYYFVVYDDDLSTLDTAGTEGTRALAGANGSVTLAIPAKVQSATAGFYRVKVSVKPSGD